MRRLRASTAFAVAVLVALPAAAAAQHEGHQMPAAVKSATTMDVTGTVLCVDGPPLPGAIVQLFTGTDAKAKLQGSALADEAGRFRIRTAPGMYELRISYLGHANHEQHVMPDEDGAASLGVIRMQITAVEVEALVATAEKDRLRLGAGTTVFDAKRAGTTAGGSVADALRNVPGLEVDPDGKIAIRGSNSVQVLLNGRRTALKDAALVAFLRQMPASSVARIESSTTSSAAQDANGTAGIVNIVFSNTDARNAGAYSLTASAATASQYMASAAATGSLGSATSWDGVYAFSTMQPQTTLHTMRDNFLAPDALRTSHQLSVAQAKHELHSVNAGVTERLDSANSLNARLAYSWMRGSFDNSTDFADISTTGTRSDAFITASTLLHTIPTTEGSLGWSFRPAGGKRLRISSEVRAAGGSERFIGAYAHPGESAFLNTDMASRRSEHVLQNDAGFNLAGVRIDFGEKSQQQLVKATYQSVRDGVPSEDAFSHKETVHAAYVNAARAAGPVYVEAGVRLEASRTTIQLTDASAASRQDVRLFPSVSVHWPHNSESAYQYQIAYNRRIERPDAAALNPYSMGEDDMNSFIGNPLLRPEITDQVQLGVEKRGTVFTFTASPFAKLSRDVIRPIKAVTESGRSTTTLQNLSRARAFGSDLSLNARLSPRLTALLSSSAFYLSSEGMAADGEALRNSGVYVNIRANVDVKLAAQTTAQLYAYRRSAQPVEQGEILPAVNSDFAVTHRFGADHRGTLTLRLSDPFNSNKLVFDLNDVSFTQRSERKVTSRAFAVFFSWAVGGESRTETPHHEDKPQIF